MLTAYELACGYVQLYENSDRSERVKLYADEHHTCYWVHHYNAGYAGQGYVNNSTSYHTLAQAQEAFRRTATDIMHREITVNAS